MAPYHSIGLLKHHLIKSQCFFKSDHVSGSDNSKAIHKTMEASKSKSKIVIMFDNIKQLELSNLDIGHSATDNNKRATVTSILIRFGKICSAVF